MKILTSIFCLLLVTSCVQQIPINKGFVEHAKNSTSNNQLLEYSKDTLIIFFDKNIGDTYLLQAIRDVQAEIIYRYSMMNGMAIKIAKNDELEHILTYFQTVKGVVSVEKDYIIRTD